MGDSTANTLRGCSHCGMVHQLTDLPDGAVARCTRCHHVIYRPTKASGNQLTAAFALAALICYPLGIFLPVMQLEQLGHINNASIWSGAVSLLTHGQIGVGLIVLVCSVVIPILKLLGLFAITVTPKLLTRDRQASVYRGIELIGRWGMVDVLLVAVVVAAVKLGDLVEVSPGPGVIAFTTCVMLSLVASASFNPHAIWETEGKPHVK